MKWLNRLSGLVLGAIAFGAIKDFLDKHTIVVFDKDNDFIEEEIEEEIEEDMEEQVKDISSLKPENYDKAMDLRGTPTHVCPCGCNIWNVKVIFNNFEITTYFLDMECANCGSLATAPTPVDNKEGF